MLIFQYGSNCLNSQLNGDDRLCGDAAFVDIARSDNCELEFNVWSKNRGCAAGDMVARPGALVWGALYDIPDYLITRDAALSAGRKSLDAIEGEGSNYKRRKVQVYRSGGQLIDAVTYTVIAPQAGLQTNLIYVGLIISGLRERSIDDDYIARVKEIAAANNPAIANALRAL